MIPLYIYNCGELHAVKESSFCFQTWAVSLVAKGIIIDFNLHSDYPHVVSLSLVLDLLCQKSIHYLDEEQFWQEVSPINKCWYDWNKHNEMN